MNFRKLYALLRIYRRNTIFKRCLRRGFSAEDARKFADRFYPATPSEKELEAQFSDGKSNDAVWERHVAIAGTDAAVYMRWVELRFKQTPNSDMLRQAIMGAFDRRHFSWKPEDIDSAEVFALACKPAAIDILAKEQGLFAELDRISASLRNQSNSN